MASKLPNIAIVGNAPKEKCGVLNAKLSEEELTDLCDLTLYGADGQPEEEALLDAVEDWRNDKVQGIVCLPFEKAIPEVLKNCFEDKAENAVGFFVNNGMKMVSVMGDVEAADAEARVTKESVVARVKQAVETLKSKFMILNPRVAVAALDSYGVSDEAEEGNDIVSLAVKELVSESGIQAFGPIDGGLFFETGEHQAYDVLVTMYDEQCIGAFLNATNGETLVVAAGVDIPLVATDYDDLLQAVFLVLDVARFQKEYARPFASPLPKLYKERKEDGDKARFAVKKKGFNPAEHRRENVNYTTLASVKAQAPT